MRATQEQMFAHMLKSLFSSGLDQWYLLVCSYSSSWASSISRVNHLRGERISQVFAQKSSCSIVSIGSDMFFDFSCDKISVDNFGQAKVVIVIKISQFQANVGEGVTRPVLFCKRARIVISVILL